MRFKITYLQDYMGETIEGSYYETVKGMGELYKSISDLETDPHVYGTEYERVD